MDPRTLRAAVGADRAAGRRPFCVAASAGTVSAVGAAVRADSVALDPHKWLSVPAECGAVLVRDGRLLREAFSLVPAYLRTEPDRGFGGLPWYSEYGIQQTRGFRALKLRMTLQRLGRDGVRDLVARHLALATHLARLVDAAPDLERLAAVELSIFCFRARRAQQARDGGRPGLGPRVPHPGHARRALRAAGLRAALRDDGVRPGRARRSRARDRRALAAA